MSFRVPDSRRLAPAGLFRRQGIGIQRGVDQTFVAMPNGTFARTGAAWRPSADDSSVVSYATDQLRSYIDGQRWFVVEGAATSHLTDNPVDISTTGGWTEANTSGNFSVNRNVAIDSPGPGIGVVNRLNFGNSANDYIFDTTLNLVISNTYRASVWARTESGTKDFRIVVREGVNFHGSATIHTATTTWKRFTINPFTVSATTNDEFRIQQSGTTPGSILVWGATLQDDAPQLLPSPILVAGATRNADNLLFPTANLPAGILSGSGFWFRLRPYFSSTQHIAHAANQNLFVGTGGTRLFRINSSAGVFRILGDLASVDSAAKTWSARQTLTIAVDWANAQVRFAGFTTGNETLNIAAAGDWDGIGTNLQVGASPSLTLPYYGEITDLFSLETSPI